MTHTTERVRVTETRSAAPQGPRRKSIGTVLGWGAVLLGLLAAIVLLVLTLGPASTPTTIDPGPTTGQLSRPGVPGSADGAERWLARNGSGAPQGAPMSADGAERYLAGIDAGPPVGVPRSADAAERWLADRHH